MEHARYENGPKCKRNRNPEPELSYRYRGGPYSPTGPVVLGLGLNPAIPPTAACCTPPGANPPGKWATLAAVTAAVAAPHPAGNRMPVGCCSM